MSSLSDLHHALARVVGWAFGSIADMDGRGHLVLYTNAKGLPAVPTATVARMKEIADREPDLSILQDALQVINGLYEVYGASLDLLHGHLEPLERTERIFDGVFAFLFPFAVAAMRRGGSETAAKWLQVLAIIDDRIADNLRGFTIGRWAQMVRAGWDTAYEDQPYLLLLPQIATAVLFPLLRGWKPFKHYSLALNGGWESPYLDRGYGRPQTRRDTPTWIAQRTLSIHGALPQKFTLARYADAAPQGEPNATAGVTVMPVPRKRAFADPSVPAPPIADPKGPGVWLRIDVQGNDHWTLGDGWTLDLRGTGAVGGLIPLGGDAEVSAGVGAGVEAELTWRPAPVASDAAPTAPSTEGGEHGGASLSVESVSLVGFVGGGATMHMLGTLGFGVRAKKLKLSITPKSSVLGALVSRSLAFNADVGIVLSDRGVTLEGGNGLELFLAAKIPLPFGFTLTYLRIAAIHRTTQTRVQVGIVEHDVETTEVGARVTAGVEWSYSKLQLTLDGIGAEIVVSTNAPGGNVLGIGHVAGDLVLPSGVGLRMDWSCVHGGGFFGYDKEHERSSAASRSGSARSRRTHRSRSSYCAAWDLPSRASRFLDSRIETPRHSACWRASGACGGSAP